MHLGGLSLFRRTNSRGLFNLAAYHSRHSLTWSWIISVQFDGFWRKPGGWLRVGFHPWRTNCGLQWTLVLPFVVLSRHVQKPMWFRDLYSRAREREDALESANSKLRRELTKTRATALATLPGGRPQ